MFRILCSPCSLCSYRYFDRWYNSLGSRRSRVWRAACGSLVCSLYPCARLKYIIIVIVF